MRRALIILLLGICTSCTHNNWVSSGLRWPFGTVRYNRGTIILYPSVDHGGGLAAAGGGLFYLAPYALLDKRNGEGTCDGVFAMPVISINESGEGNWAKVFWLPSTTKRKTTFPWYSMMSDHLGNLYWEGEGIGKISKSGELAWAHAISVSGPNLKIQSPRVISTDLCIFDNSLYIAGWLSNGDSSCNSETREPAEDNQEETRQSFLARVDTASGHPGWLTRVVSPKGVDVKCVAASGQYVYIVSYVDTVDDSSFGQILVVAFDHKGTKQGAWLVSSEDRKSIGPLQASCDKEGNLYLLVGKSVAELRENLALLKLDCLGKLLFARFLSATVIWSSNSIPSFAVSDECQVYVAARTHGEPESIMIYLLRANGDLISKWRIPCRDDGIIEHIGIISVIRPTVVALFAQADLLSNAKLMKVVKKDNNGQLRGVSIEEVNVTCNQLEVSLEKIRLESASFPIQLKSGLSHKDLGVLILKKK